MADHFVANVIQQDEMEKSRVKAAEKESRVMMQKQLSAPPQKQSTLAIGDVSGGAFLTQDGVLIYMMCV